MKKLLVLIIAIITLVGINTTTPTKPAETPVMMIAQDFKEVKIIWKSTNITKATGYGMSYRATITCRV